MRKIKTYSRKNYNLTFSIWELNIISFVKAYHLPHERCKLFDVDKFFYEFEKEHGLLHIAENYENYSYS